MQPTLAGFLLFLRNVVGIPTTVLPDNSIYIGWAFAVASAIVNPQLQGIPIPTADSTGAQLTGGVSYSIYSQAVFFLGADNIFNYAQDLPNAPKIDGGDLPYFQFYRKTWNINGFVSGVIQSSSDQGTSQSLVVQEAAKAFTLANLQNLKTPYGRTYLGLAQSYGPSTWGIT